MYWRFHLATITELLLRLAIAAVFAYFGFHAIREPVAHAAQWIRPEFASLISQYVSVAAFTMILGTLEMLVAIALVIRVMYRVALVVAIMLLIGIMVNLGFNDLMLRDAVIAAACAYLYATA